ncbi:MAG: hypothetical protein HOH66_00235 [Rhodospirillaceae bacterium]|nr:hypothetical protein [Rhodospirillaceae bacterium]MBT6116276.1 hypothetical protein [Rhodospirillaceae bacterium]
MATYLPILLGAGAGLGGLLMYLGLIRIRNAEDDGGKRRGLLVMNVGLILLGVSMYALTQV